MVYCTLQGGFRRGDLYHKDHLSPPSSVTRLSDSDISEFDLVDDLTGVHPGKVPDWSNLSTNQCLALGVVCCLHGFNGELLLLDFYGF